VIFKAIHDYAASKLFFLFLSHFKIKINPIKIVQKTRDLISAIFGMALIGGGSVDLSGSSLANATRQIWALNKDILSSSESSTGHDQNEGNFV